MSRRMLALGLDAADSTLIQKWSDEGILPTFALLRKKGAWVPLVQDQPIPSASVWPSIYTGTHPGKHGIYNSLQIEPGKQEVNLIEPNQCGAPPFWWTLDRHAKASIVVDVPFSYPLKDFGGIQILDWGSYERHYQSQSSPSEILTEVCKRFGRYPFGEEMSRDTPSSARHFSRARTQLLAGTMLKGTVVRWLMEHRSWDFLMAVFSETHPAGHYFWNFHSNDHGDRVSESPPEFATTIKDVYSALDAQIGKIMDMLDEATMLVVLSGQGMGRNTAKWHFIPEVLSRLGLLVTKKDPKSLERVSRLADFRDAIPRQWRRAVSRYLPGALRDQLQVHWANSNVDWAQTRAFHMPTDLLGYIRINLKGREPNGIVEPGSEYAHVCNTISEALKELVDSKTGTPIVREVYHTDQIYPGPQRQRLPDLLVTWEDEPVAVATDPEGLSRPIVNLSDPRSGNHRPEGFAIFYRGGMSNDRLSPAHIVDVAPTILNYFGLKTPSNMDGKNLINSAGNS